MHVHGSSIGSDEMPQKGRGKEANANTNQCIVPLVMHSLWIQNENNDKKSTNEFGDESENKNPGSCSSMCERQCWRIQWQSQ